MPFNAAMIAEILAAIDAFEADTDIGAIVVAGSEKAFAAGAAIKGDGVAQVGRGVCRLSR
jgi:enoyl-CoA hydratase/carnithine racemase